jgi:hypothetical protein
MEDDTESVSSGRSNLSRARAVLSGMRARRSFKDIPEVKRRELVERSLDLGLSAARRSTIETSHCFPVAWTRCSPVSIHS